MRTIPPPDFLIAFLAVALLFGLATVAASMFSVYFSI